MMEYPTELVAKAKYELAVFERVAMDTGAELVSEVERLRAQIELPREFAQEARRSGSTRLASMAVAILNA